MRPNWSIAQIAQIALRLWRSEKIRFGIDFAWKTSKYLFWLSFQRPSAARIIDRFGHKRHQKKRYLMCNNIQNISSIELCFFLISLVWLVTYLDSILVNKLISLTPKFSLASIVILVIDYWMCQSVSFLFPTSLQLR